MAWSGGVFSRVRNWVSDKNNGIKIVASLHDQEDDNLATAGINECLNKAGQNTPTGDLPMDGFLHTGVGDATARDNYPSVAQLQDGGIIWGGTASGSSNNFTFDLSPIIPAYVSGQKFAFISNQSINGAATININSLGSKSITKNGTSALVSGDIVNGEIVEIIYDGTRFQLLSRTPTANVPAVSLITTKTSTAASTIQFSTTDLGAISGSFYLIKFDGLNPGTSNVNLLFKISGNNLSSFATCTTDAIEGRRGTTSVDFLTGTNVLMNNLEALGPSPSSACSGYIILPVASASRWTRMDFKMSGEKVAGSGGDTTSSGSILDGGSLASWNSFQFELSSGNFTNQGTVSVYRYS